MSGFNKVVLMGNVTRDPQLKQLPSEVAVVDFGLASNRRYKTAAGEDKEETLFIDCAAFGKQAETIHKFVKTGKPLLLEGRLRYDTWEDKSGGKRSKISLVVESFQFLPSPRDAAAPAAETPAAKPGKRPGSAELPFKSAAKTKLKESEIPF